MREEWGRLVALLLARFRRLDLVEDALGDAVEAASRTWPADGVARQPGGLAAHRGPPPRPRPAAHRGGGAAQAAAARHRASAAGKEARAMADPGALVEDDLLRLVLMCTHPALAPEAASALALRLVLGVPTPDIARLFLVPEPTMAARITRAKKRIVGAGIPFAVPDAVVLPDRLDTVAQTAYLAFTAGYAPGTGPDLLRAETSGEAIRLVRVVLALRPDEPVLVALLALMLLQHSRRDARVARRPPRAAPRPGPHPLAPRRDRRGARAARPPGAAPARSPCRRRRTPCRRGSPPSTPPRRPPGGHPVGADRRRCTTCCCDVAPSPERPAGPGGRGGRGTRPGRRARRAGGHRDPVDSHRVAAVRAELLARDGDSDAARAAYDQAIAACRNDVERAPPASRGGRALTLVSAPAAAWRAR